MVAPPAVKVDSVRINDEAIPAYGDSGVRLPPMTPIAVQLDYHSDGPLAGVLTLHVGDPDAGRGLDLDQVGLAVPVQRKGSLGGNFVTDAGGRTSIVLKHDDAPIYVLTLVVASTPKVLMAGSELPEHAFVYTPLPAEVQSLTFIARTTGGAELRLTMGARVQSQKVVDVSEVLSKEGDSETAVELQVPRHPVMVQVEVFQDGRPVWETVVALQRTVA
jgi:hypothetical protein